jgi:hypothetical protein
VSELDSVQQAYRHYEESKRRERYFWPTPPTK